MNYDDDKYNETWASLRQLREDCDRRDMIAANCILIALGAGVIYLLWEIMK